MVNVKIVDVMGPLPGDSSCFVIAKVIGDAGNDKMFGIQCSYADAEMANSSLNDSPLTNPYEFMTDVLQTAGIKIDKVELDTVAPCIYGKLFMSSEALAKPLKIVSSSPVAVLNSALSAKAPVEMADEMAGRIIDCTVEYHRLKSAMGNFMFPMPLIDNTNILRLLSELLDKIQFRQTYAL